MESEGYIKQLVFAKMTSDLNKGIEASIMSDTPIVPADVYAQLSVDKGLAAIRPYNYLNKLDVLQQNIDKAIPMEDWVLRGIYRHFQSFLVQITKQATTEAEYRAARLRVARKMQAVSDCFPSLRYMPGTYTVFDLMFLPYTDAIKLVGTRDALCMLVALACNCLYIYEVMFQGVWLCPELFRFYMEIRETDSINYVCKAAELMLMHRKDL